MHGLISTYNYLISSCAYPKTVFVTRRQRKMNAELQNAPGEEEEGRICDTLSGVAADPPCCGQESCCGALVCRVMLMVMVAAMSVAVG